MIIKNVLTDYFSLSLLTTTYNVYLAGAEQRSTEAYGDKKSKH